DDADLPTENQVGLVHIALVTDGVPTGRHYYDRAKALAVEITGWTNHTLTNSLYVKDPEGNTIEIYADVPLEEYNWPERGMGFISRPFDIEAVPAPTTTQLWPRRGAVAPRPPPSTSTAASISGIRCGLEWPASGGPPRSDAPATASPRSAAGP